MLHYAITNKNIDRLEWALSTGSCNVNEANHTNQSTPLHTACLFSFSDGVWALIAANANVNALDANGKSPLHYSCEYSSVRKDLVEMLVAAGADVNAADRHGWTPLHYACWGKYSSDIACTLIEANANLDAKTFSPGNTALHYACDHGCDSIVAVLLAAGADVSIENNDGLTPMDFAENWPSIREQLSSYAGGKSLKAARQVP